MKAPTIAAANRPSNNRRGHSLAGAGTLTDESLVCDATDCPHPDRLRNGISRLRIASSPNTETLSNWLFLLKFMHIAYTCKQLLVLRVLACAIANPRYHPFPDAL